MSTLLYKDYTCPPQKDDIISLIFQGYAATSYNKTALEKRSLPQYSRQVNKYIKVNKFHSRIRKACAVTKSTIDYFASFIIPKDSRYNPFNFEDVQTCIKVFRKEFKRYFPSSWGIGKIESSPAKGIHLHMVGGFNCVSEYAKSQMRALLENLWREIVVSKDISASLVQSTYSNGAYGYLTKKKKKTNDIKFNENHPHIRRILFFNKKNRDVYPEEHNEYTWEQFKNILQYIQSTMWEILPSMVTKIDQILTKDKMANDLTNIPKYYFDVAEACLENPFLRKSYRQHSPNYEKQVKIINKLLAQAKTDSGIL